MICCVGQEWLETRESVGDGTMGRVGAFGELVVFAGALLKVDFRDRIML